LEAADEKFDLEAMQRFEKGLSRGEKKCEKGAESIPEQLKAKK